MTAAGTVRIYGIPGPERVVVAMPESGFGSGIYGTARDHPRSVAWSASLKTPGGASLGVHVAWIDGRCHPGTGPAGEDTGLPSWPVRIRPSSVSRREPPCIAVLEIDVPAQVRLAGIFPPRTVTDE